MKKITIKIQAALPVTYPIFIEPGLLQYPSVWLPGDFNFSAIVIITDHTVKKLYGCDLAIAMKNQGYESFLLSFPPGEKNKNNFIKHVLERKMLGYHCDRNTLCLALGGGVVGDLAGFIAATYMRGIPYIQIPTSLLAMVDSSIGGKTGIDTDDGKNLIGAFWQPKAVVADLNCLKTLPQKHLVNGLVEIIKIFLINDQKSFLYFQKNIEKIRIGDEAFLNNLILWAIKIKSSIVSQDEKDNNLRKILNFGHTIGHAIECMSGYKMTHGEAVGLGILVESRISNLLGILSDEDYFCVVDVMLLLGFSFEKLKKININKVIQATKLDKKISSEQVRYPPSALRAPSPARGEGISQVNYVLLKTIGRVYEHNGFFVHSVADDVVRQAFHGR